MEFLQSLLINTLYSTCLTFSIQHIHTVERITYNKGTKCKMWEIQQHRRMQPSENATALGLPEWGSIRVSCRFLLTTSTSMSADDVTLDGSIFRNWIKLTFTATVCNCRNMMDQQRGRGPAPYMQTQKAHCKLNRKQWLIFQVTGH